MPKKFKIAQVAIRVEVSATKYLRESPHKAGLADLLKGVKDTKNWQLEADAKGQVIAA